MKKLWVTVILFFVFVFTVKDSLVLAVSEVDSKSPEINSFELFWPVVAGKVQGDNLYTLKLFKEKIRGYFIFSVVKKAEYFSFLSTKRLVEYEKLTLVDKDINNASKTLTAVLNMQRKAMTYLDRAEKEGSNTVETVRIVTNTFNRQLSLLNSIAIKSDNSQKPAIENAISSLILMLEELL